jgi:predicted permease
LGVDQPTGDRLIDALLHDVRLAIGQLRRRPLFVIGSALSLALGMSLATALFSIIDSALLRPLTYAESERLVELYETTPKYDVSRVSARMLEAVRRDSRSFSGVAAFVSREGMLGRSGESRRVGAVAVTTNFFDVLRVRPLRGETFSPDDVVSDDQAAVISHSLWQADFGASPDVIGRTLILGGKPFRIIGVMPASFEMPVGAQIWLRLANRSIAASAAVAVESYSPYYAFARLAPGVANEQASAELALEYRRLYGDSGSARLHSARVVPLSEHVTRGLREQLRLWGAAAILILILCAVNFATMSLARGMRRRDDIAVRAALGASRGRIVRMLVVEATLLASLGGIIAVVFATWMLSYIVSLVAEGPLGVTASIDWKTVAFSVGTTVVVGFVFALAPAVELAAVDLRSLMAGGAQGTTAKRGELRGRRSLVALQLALALTAVAAVTALIKADRRFVVSSVGFDYSRVLVGSAFGADSSVRRMDVESVLNRIREAPGVVNAAATGSMYAVALIATNDAVVEGPTIYQMHVSPTYFATLGVVPTAGRLPSAEEVSSAADVVVLSRSTAVRAFGSDSAAIGKILRVKRPRQRTIAATVVGVVPDVGANGLYNFSSPLYVVRPLRDEPGGSLVVRTSGDPQYRIKDIGRSLSSMDSRVAVGELRTARSIVDRALGATRGRTIFLTTVAALALFLAVVGVYSLTAYTTELRARELGIRIALGAGKVDITRVVLGELWWMALVGVAVGVGASAQLVSYMDDLFRHPMARVPLITLPVAPTIATAATLLVILVLGTVVPIRRVLRLDVMRTIQAQ